MNNQEVINQYDLVEIMRVPEGYEGVINIGDIGTVLEKYDQAHFSIECVRRDGSTKWLETLHIKYIRLRSKDPFSAWVKTSLIDRSMTQRSIDLGALLGAAFGVLMGAGLGAITGNFNGVFIGMAIGLVLGVITGAFTAALTVKTAGTTGGIGVGYFTGLVFGGILGMLIGLIVPTSLRMKAHTEGMPVLDALVMGRFETAVFFSFLLSILAAMVGVWIGGKNVVPRDWKK